MDRITCRFIYNDELLGDILVKPYKSAKYVKFRISDGTVSATVPFAVPLQTFVQTDAKQKAYMAGIQIGQQVSGDMFDAINNRIFSGDSTQSLSKDQLTTNVMRLK